MSFRRYLLEHGLLDEEALRRAEAEAARRGVPLYRVLLDEGLLEEERFLRACSELLGLPLLDPEELPRHALPLEGINPQFLREHCLLPLGVEEDGGVRLAIGDPFDLDAINVLRRCLDGTLRLVLAPRRQLEETIDRLYGQTAQPPGEEPPEEDVEVLRDRALEAPVVRMVNLIIARAVEMRASDIHFEPFRDAFRVRYRIDGVLHEMDTPPKRLQAAILSRLKLMAGMNIAERRLPQDGRIKVRLGEEELDIRVSSVPTVFGESVVLRLLGRERMRIDLEAIGFEGPDFQRFRELIRLPYGIILVTGPTGSGKTTTLYGVLREIYTPELKVITVEDPVEYQIEGVNQIQVRPQIGLTFANVLRSILRQDPDVILIGEIRDRETAEIAVEAALTGHMVFSTLHTNDAVGAITRMRDLGIEPFLITSSLVAVLAQRLVRKVCPHCRQEYVPEPAVLERLRREAGLGEPVRFQRGMGCRHCAHTGYLGRTGIFELLPLSESLKSALLEGAPEERLREIALREGMRTLLADGLDKALRGVTTPEEVLRVTRR